ncbi:hypothetical protein VCUG_00244 [Vavraia culicis subsp. floridensis]|uniref:Uncharacterized protein n=1 Tax=Vavraia culicis (isolate floridensis) TaxID=948595 RepID=L2GY32_VAVCU|nr:uncharacterized protein VCUG_00244 [Vavraia culicis subsp. floridensis]ELA48203.1 hypothetical protein VCUG_00244 [Vavraia culicis subsp. floridensis]
MNALLPFLSARGGSVYKNFHEKSINVFFLNLLLEIITYGMCTFFIFSCNHKKITLSFSFSLVMGNLFLIDSILLKNVYQMYLYTIFYVYTLSLMTYFLFDEINTRISRVFGMLVILLFLIRGSIIIYKSKGFIYEFSWYYYKKIGCESTINGK